MSEESQTVPPDDPSIAPPPPRVVALVLGLRHWAAVHWMRSAVIAATLILLLAGTVATWVYLAHLAIQAGEVTLNDALAALDAGEDEKARAMVRRMFENKKLPRSEHGGPLFVLGALKIHDARGQTVADRRRTEYLVASRYLAEARIYGFPQQRATEGLFLLGKSLLESAQTDEGVQVLEELLDKGFKADDPLFVEIHRLLADTEFFAARPDFDKVLAHNSAVLESLSLSDDARADALLQRAEIFNREKQFDEARQALAQIPTAVDRRVQVAMMQGLLLLGEATAEPPTTEQAGQEKPTDTAIAKIDQATKLFQEAQSIDQEATDVTRRSLYLIGRAHELRGDRDAAWRQFVQVRQLYGDTAEGQAAALCEADLLRHNGDMLESLQGYRRVLENVVEPRIYRSSVLPLEDFRHRVMDAETDFVKQGYFEEALAILDRFPPLVSRIVQTQLRGDALRQWGQRQLEQAADHDPPDAALQAAGLRHLREAGKALEQLAELRYATEHYTDDLWNSAEYYFLGHSYSSTVRLLNEYLNNEPEVRNSQALLRLGQSQLALGHIDQCIAALEECIEFHPRDGASFQARIDCAKAYWYYGNMDEAERLLQANLMGSSLKPSSQEWKDSLFELGILLNEKGRHEEAIGTLEEAVERYPNDRQVLLAQYLIGESYRQWAADPLERLRQSRTSGEREKNFQIARERLQNALHSFEEVQRSITLKSHDVHRDQLMGTMLRNCYMHEGTVLFDLGQYEDAIKAYSNVSSLYPNEPFVLETFVQIANCWRRLERADKARGAVQQALIALERLPTDADFATVTSFNREEWRLLLTDMSRW